LTINSAINNGIAKLRKYYSKTGSLNIKNKTLYLLLIFDPRIKIEGLSLIDLTSGLSIDIKNKLKEEYNL
jgi:hypothetical protein